MKLTKEQLLKLLEAAYGVVDAYGTLMHLDVRSVTENYLELANCEGERCRYFLTNAYLSNDMLGLKRFEGLDGEEQYESFDVLTKASTHELDQLIGIDE